MCARVRARSCGYARRRGRDQGVSSEISKGANQTLLSLSCLILETGLYSSLAPDDSHHLRN